MKKTLLLITALLLSVILSTGVAGAGPYTGDGIAGFVGPDGDGVVSDDNYVNPVFVNWATGCTYDPFDLAEIQNYMSGEFSHPERTLGPVTGNNFDIASLGDMDSTEIAAWQADPVSNHGPGEITLSFDSAIYNGDGYDFAVFENGFWQSGHTSGPWFFAELGYVEVSTDGVNFASFDSVSLTSGQVGPYGTVDPTDIHNLAGKHANAYGDSWGTGFDLDDLLGNSLVLSGLVDLDDINFIKIVDIPGSGDFLDSNGNPIYDAWPTWGSGGVDLEAVGVINAVPIPGALWLLGSGLLGILGIRRRRNF
ncbi:MAG: hypothetical protein PVG39_30155 [Desulfobacteraceae bacterium]|jgi:hypothetical protein